MTLRHDLNHFLESTYEFRSVEKRLCGPPFPEEHVRHGKTNKSRLAKLSQVWPIRCLAVAQSDPEKSNKKPTTSHKHCTKNQFPFMQLR